MEQSNWPTSQPPSELSALERPCVILSSSSVLANPSQTSVAQTTAALGRSLRTCFAGICSAMSYILSTLTIPEKSGMSVTGTKSLFLGQCYYYHHALFNDQHGGIELFKTVPEYRILVILRINRFFFYKVTCVLIILLDDKCLTGVNLLPHRLLSAISKLAEENSVF